MIQRYMPLIILLGFILIGFAKKVIELLKIKDKLDFAYNYRNKLIDLINEYTESGNINNALYIDLTEKVSQMQNDLGDFGLVTVLDNLYNTRVNNQQFLVNFLPQIREMDYWVNDTIMRHRFMKSANTCDDMILRYTGALQNNSDVKRKHLFNPFSCLADGIRWILWLPANILIWCGFISARIGNILKNNWLIKLFTITVTIVGLISSIVTVIIGWDQTVAILQRWIG